MIARTVVAALVLFLVLDLSGAVGTLFSYLSNKKFYLYKLLILGWLWLIILLLFGLLVIRGLMIGDLCIKIIIIYINMNIVTVMSDNKWIYKLKRIEI